MSFVRATVFGRLRDAMQAEVRAVAGGLRRAVATTGREVQTELRAQARSAGFKDGGRSIANAWRLKLYPAAGTAPTTFKPAALIWSRMPTVVTAFDRGGDGVPSLETSLNANSIRVFPGTGVNDSFTSSDADSQVGVYPNPYRLNAAWDGATPFTRRLMFYNLPAKAQIRVYTLAGEIVATLDHDAATYTGDTRWFNDFSVSNRLLPGGEHAWDILSDANQNLTTGLYLYTVKDAATGHIQTGKLVIIK